MKVAGLLVLLCLLPGQVHAVPNNLHLFILARQSNMVGMGNVSELPEDFPRHKNRIWNFTNAYLWQRAKEPIDSPFYQVDQVSRDNGAGVGPGLAFADRLAELQPGIHRTYPVRKGSLIHRRVGTFKGAGHPARFLSGSSPFRLEQRNHPGDPLVSGRV